MSTWTAGYVNLYGEHEDGCAKRTVEAGSFNVDLDAGDRIIGVEWLCENQDWRDALAVLAMQGRLMVEP